MLGVDEALEKRGHEVDELDVRRDGEERHLEAVGLGEHLGGHLAEVGERADDETGAAFVGDAADEADLRVGVVLDRKAACEHQVARSRLDLGRLHEADPLDLAVEALRAGHEGGRDERRAHHLADCGARFLGFAGVDVLRRGGHDGTSLGCGPTTSNVAWALYGAH